MEDSLLDYLGGAGANRGTWLAGDAERGVGLVGYAGLVGCAELVGGSG
jgi:hypothetical protein